jgi:hypothetical protein
MYKPFRRRPFRDGILRQQHQSTLLKLSIFVNEQLVVTRKFLLFIITSFVSITEAFDISKDCHQRPLLLKNWPFDPSLSATFFPVFLRARCHKSTSTRLTDSRPHSPIPPCRRINNKTPKNATTRRCHGTAYNIFFRVCAPDS